VILARGICEEAFGVHSGRGLVLEPQQMPHRCATLDCSPEMFSVTVRGDAALDECLAR